MSATHLSAERRAMPPFSPIHTAPRRGRVVVMIDLGDEVRFSLQTKPKQGRACSWWMPEPEWRTGRLPAGEPLLILDGDDLGFVAVVGDQLREIGSINRPLLGGIVSKEFWAEAWSHLPLDPRPA